MTAKKKKRDLSMVKKALPYVLVGSITLLVVFFGSIDKQNNDTSLSLDNFAANDYNISVDQMSELYTVADLSDALRLTSASDVASNYVSTMAMYESGQTSASKLEKPSLTNINSSRGVIQYTVKEGDSMETIAATYGLTTDQIRWSNGLKTTDVSVDMVLYLPSTSGIVYTVKSGDTIESIIDKYGSNRDEIIALNDLEVSGIAEGARILIKGGSLPETERPEYVPPAPVRRTYSYTYLGDTSSRVNAVCDASKGGGQCTSWGWLKRPDLKVIMNDAKGWANDARILGFLVNNTPAAGAIFQTESGWFGHVGYVESVNADGSINVSERNYSSCWYGVLYSTIPASEVGKFNYIH